MTRVTLERLVAVVSGGVSEEDEGDGRQKQQRANDVEDADDATLQRITSGVI